MGKAETGHQANSARGSGKAHTVTLGEGHAMVDEHKVEGTCDWMPGMRTATATQGTGEVLGLKVTRQRHPIATPPTAMKPRPPGNLPPDAYPDRAETLGKHVRARIIWRR